VCYFAISQNGCQRRAPTRPGEKLSARIKRTLLFLRASRLAFPLGADAVLSDIVMVLWCEVLMLGLTESAGGNLEDFFQ